VSDLDGLICAYVLDGRGGARELQWAELDSMPTGGFSWVHLNLEGEKTRGWLSGKSGLPEIVIEALTYDEVRPRCTPLGEGLLVNLRGVNLNPGADPEDMVAVRIYIDAQRAITVRRRRMMAVNDIRDRLAAGTGPLDADDFLVELATRLVERMGPVIADLDDEIDALEDKAIGDAHADLRAQLWDLRRVAIELRRYIAPQRDAMTRLTTERVSWIDAQAGQRLREVADRITRYVEDLDAARERAAIIQDELTTRLAEAMNRNMYMLSIIAAIFLPLSLLTGLLGINVGGIPGVEWEWAFWSVTLGILAIGIAGYVLLRRLRWV
jgi:zinc transporter